MAVGAGAVRVTAPCLDVTGGPPPEPCVMVIFGASGDLAHIELVPSMYELAALKLLPDPFAIIGIARTSWSDAEFRAEMRRSVKDSCHFDAECWDEFAAKLYYITADFTSSDAFKHLKRRLEDIRTERGIPDNVFFHFSVPPAFFGTIADQLGHAGLDRSKGGWRRVVVEKPFGHDRESARGLDQELRTIFDEDQIYRIDHFLGKETVQNMLVVRFANPSFEPIWNHQYIDQIQITVAEDIGIKERGAFYEQTGILRDMVQNHLLQLLCMAAIEPPVHYSGAALRDETVKVLRSVGDVDPARCVLGQYGAGMAGGKQVSGYRQEDEVGPESLIATFAALRLTLNNWRWAGVPIYLRTGKRMARKITEVAVHFRPTPYLMFPLKDGQRLPGNWVIFRLQPQEGILSTLIAKQPGPEICLTSVTSHFLYTESFGVEEPPRAYAWLLRDVMQGEQTLFARSDWIDEAWGIVDPIIEYVKRHPPVDFPNYAAGSWGPPAADELIRRDGLAWRSD